MCGYFDQRVDQVVHQCRIDNCLKRHLAAEHIPAAEYGPFIETLRLMYLFIRSGIFTVHIATDTRIDHCMVQSRIKGCLIVIRATVYFHFRQFVIPKPAASCIRFIEVPVFHFSRQVLFRILQAGKGDTAFKQDFLAGFCFEIGIEAQVFAFKQRNGRMDSSLADHFMVTLAFYIFPFTAPTIGNIGRPNAMFPERP